MSIKGKEVPFTLSDCGGSESFAGIIDLGFTERGSFIVAAWLCPPPEPRGRYFTSIPISEMEHRRRHGTGAAYRRSEGKLTLFDDWGRWHEIAAPDSILDALVAECIANEIPASPSPEDRVRMRPLDGDVGRGRSELSGRDPVLTAAATRARSRGAHLLKPRPSG